MAPQISSRCHWILLPPADVSPAIPRPKQSQFSIENTAGKGQIRHVSDCAIRSVVFCVSRRNAVLYQGGDAALEREEAQVDIDGLL
jgi:hypothetical protein